MMRNSAIIYRSFYEAIKEIPELNQAEVWNAIMEYSLNFNEIELHGLSKTIFILIKPQLEANIQRFKNGSVTKTKQKESKTEAENNQTKSKTSANNNNNNNKKDKEKKEKLIILDDVLSYFKENDYPEHLAKKFFEFYSVSNWKDSNGKVVQNWKQKAQSVWFKEENRISKPNSKTINLQSWL